MIADNSGSGVGADVRGNATANNSLIESSDGGADTGVGLIVGIDPLLNPLADNGGFTLPDGSTIQTVLSQLGSRLRNAGSNTQTLTTDVRGVGFARTIGATTDIGAVEQSLAEPSAKRHF